MKTCPGCGQELPDRRKKCASCREWDKRAPRGADWLETVPGEYVFPRQMRSNSHEQDEDIWNNI